ncbi:MAG: hypothetical protein EBE86_023900 [Hormoscilla sp. GUM202]|nr:hypothetical protein [Hormoscilla sp. GUM202]
MHPQILSEQEGEFDSDTRWALTWFEQYQYKAASYGEAETLSKAKNTSIQGMVDAGMLEAVSGKVRLLKREELLTDWVPKDNVPDWGITQYPIRELAKLGDRGEIARDLAYRYR